MSISITGDDVLTCERGEYIENDKNVLAIICDDCVSKKTAEHIPLKWSKGSFKFLQFTNNHLCVEVTRRESFKVLDLGLKYL